MSQKGNTTMNWDRLEGQWEQAKGALKTKWAKLTDDDLGLAAGKRDKLVGKLQERYGLLKDDAERQIDEWIASFDAKAEDAKKMSDRAGEKARDLELQAEQRVHDFRERASEFATDIKTQASEKADAVGKKAARFVENVTSPNRGGHDQQRSSQGRTSQPDL
jgi:uncharacterized protein YjbJ (UPF0337 family)